MIRKISKVHMARLSHIVEVRILYRTELERKLHVYGYYGVAGRQAAFLHQKRWT